MSDYGLGVAETETHGFDLPSDGGFVSTAAYASQEQGFDVTSSEDASWFDAYEDEEGGDADSSNVLPEGNYVASGVKTQDRVNQFTGKDEISCSVLIKDADGRGVRVWYELQPRKSYNDHNGKVAWNYVLFKQAMTTYRLTNGIQPSSLEEFKDYLENATLEYRLLPKTNGKGMKVMEIGLPRAGGSVDDDIPF